MKKSINWKFEVPMTNLDPKLTKDPSVHPWAEDVASTLTVECGEAIKLIFDYKDHTGGFHKKEFKIDAHELETITSAITHQFNYPGRTPFDK